MLLDVGMSLPTQHIEEAWQSAEFYANKVLMEFRNTEPAHVDWIKNLKDVLLKMKDHVQKHHRAGPAWNPQGIPVSAFLPSSKSAPTSAGVTTGLKKDCSEIKVGNVLMQ